MYSVVYQCHKKANSYVRLVPSIASEEAGVLEGRPIADVETSMPGQVEAIDGFVRYAEGA